MNVTTFHRYCIITDSTALKEADYDPATETLRVSFQNGNVWVYKDVPKHIYSLLVSADSPGKYYNSLIRGKFEGENVTPTLELANGQ